MIVIIVYFNLIILNNIKSERDTIYNKSIINDARIKVKPSLDIAKELILNEKYKSEFTKQLNRDKLKALIMDTNSKMLYKSSGLEDKVNSLDESIYMDNSFLASDNHLYKITFPIIIDNTLKGNAIFYINSREVYKNKNLYLNRIKWLAAVEIFLLIILISIMYLILRQKVFKPIYNLKKAVSKINNGDFEFEIPHDDSEVGDFAASFELMRDEIYENIKLKNYMEKSNKELIAAISHDIRTPVATISAYIEAIKSGIAKDEKKLNKYLDIIYRKSLELKKLTEDLFMHSQINADKLNINKSEVYFKKFIEKLVEPLKLEIENLDMTFKIETDIPDIIINIDERRMKQVLLNIIENSKKYGKKNGEIKLYFELVESKIKVEIKDNGIGIKAQDMPYIFDKFYRGEKSRNKAYGGAGLGLSICKSIVEAHDGQIVVESLEGQETTVSFTIPVDNF